MSDIWFCCICSMSNGETLNNCRHCGNNKNMKPGTKSNWWSERYCKSLKTTKNIERYIKRSMPTESFDEAFENAWKIYGPNAVNKKQNYYTNLKLSFEFVKE